MPDLFYLLSLQNINYQTKEDLQWEHVFIQSFYAHTVQLYHKGFI